MKVTKEGTGWQARSVIPLGVNAKGHPRELHVTTYKSNGWLATVARVIHVDGHFHVYATGDFHRPLTRSTRKATQGLVTAQHELAMQGVDALVADAKAHYAAYETTPA